MDGLLPAAATLAVEMKIVIAYLLCVGHYVRSPQIVLERDGLWGQDTGIQISVLPLPQCGILGKILTYRSCFLCVMGL